MARRAGAGGAAGSGEFLIAWIAGSGRTGLDLRSAHSSRPFRMAAEAPQNTRASLVAPVC